MKKFIPIFLIALLLGTVSSCKKKHVERDEEEETSASINRTFSALEDSLSATYGDIMGLSIYAALQDSNMIAFGVNKDNLMKTVEKAFMKDTTLFDHSNERLYGIGMQICMGIMNLEKSGVSTNTKLALNHIKTTVNCDTIDINSPQTMAKYQQLQSEYQRLLQKALQEEGEKNQVDGKNYIDKQMKKDKAFIQTGSGLCYKILKEGNGAYFNKNDVVNVIYVGKHINGEEFDSSKGKTVPFPLQNVIPGFREVITKMKPGSKAIAIIPGNIAYGETGNPTGGIGPNETLVFELTTVGL